MGMGIDWLTTSRTQNLVSILTNDAIGGMLCYRRVHRYQYTKTLTSGLYIRFRRLQATCSIVRRAKQPLSPTHHHAASS